MHSANSSLASKKSKKIHIRPLPSFHIFLHTRTVPVQRRADLEENHSDPREVLQCATVLTVQHRFSDTNSRKPRWAYEIWHTVSVHLWARLESWHCMLRCGERFAGQRQGFVISGQNVVNGRQRVTGGTVQFGMRTFPEILDVRSMDFMVSWMFTLERGVFSCSTPYCGFYVNLLQPAAWAEDTRIGYDIVTLSVTSTFWCKDSLDDENGTMTLVVSSVQPMLWLDRSAFGTTRCIGIMRIMPPSSCLVYLDVIDIGYIELMVWIFDLNFLLYRLWGWWAEFHLEMWVGDYSGRNIIVEQRYWTGLRWWRRTEHSVLHLSLKRCDLYVTSWFGDGT